MGAGYASSYLTNIRARTLGQDDPNLRQAIQSLEGLGMKPVKGFGLLPSAVAWQSEKRMRTIIQQQANTGLSYGELLLANALAAKSKKSFDRIVSMRARTHSWGALADQLDVDRDFLLTKVKVAADRIVAVDSWMRHRPPPEGGTNYTSINPHIQRRNIL